MENDSKPTDVVFSDDILSLRLEIVRLRTYLDTEWNTKEALRIRCEHLADIINSLISHDYGNH